jgi:hypothetical protein
VGAIPNLVISNGSTQLISILAKTSNVSGDFNPAVQANDSLIYFSSGTVNTGNLVIAPWNTVTGGIRINSAGTVNVASTASSTSAVTGALTVAGGAGIGGALFVNGGTISAAGSLDLQGNTGAGSPWTTVNWNKGITLAQRSAIFWPKGTGNVAKGIVADNTNVLYFVAATVDNASVAPTNPFSFNMVTGDFVASGNVTAYSDINLKTDLEVIPNALSKVLQLTGYTYTRTDTNERQTGLIAQDVEKVLPEAVIQGDHLSLAYGNLAGLLVESIKELTAEVKILEAEIKELKNR